MLSCIEHDKSFITSRRGCFTGDPHSTIGNATDPYKTLFVARVVSCCRENSVTVFINFSCAWPKVI